MSTSVPFLPFSMERLEPAISQARAKAFYEAMDKRRTVRAFSAEPIPEGVIENAIHTAGSAPSGAHKQPWFFAVVRNPEIKRQIRIAAEKEEKENYERRFSEEWLEDLAIFRTNAIKSYLETAPALIVVFKQAYGLVDGEKVKHYYVNESVGIAAGFLIAALHHAGLATLTHTPNPMGFLNEILERPKNETPILLLPVGYPSVDAEVPDLKRKALDEIMRNY